MLFFWGGSFLGQAQHYRSAGPAAFFRVRPLGHYGELQVEFSAAVHTSTEQKELILKLEQDLSTIQAMSSLPRPDADGSEVTNLGLIPEPIKEATAMFAGSGVSPHPELPQGQMDSLLSIISSQRERYRSRNQELEAENRALQQTMQALQSELDSLRADNIKLYEKIKFLQSYPSKAGGSDDTVMRYSSQYEERLDPFASFSKKQRNTSDLNRQYRGKGHGTKYTCVVVPYRLSFSLTRATRPAEPFDRADAVNGDASASWFVEEEDNNTRPGAAGGEEEAAASWRQSRSIPTVILRDESCVQGRAVRRRRTSAVVRRSLFVFRC
ncbi:hypothetical protein F2P81_017116 [Scophthalmus maximus]|uniref:CASP C-terminal domain-containing protein n=1 Tax=Scophthalmus maximus TaxID=52904 RepID=A0A6A4SD44_SCOMX|nr:hypothetical protein F2P81_017116 [Scophthalmus maximus]